MKTKEQIIEWLKSNGLYEAFAKNVSSENVENRVEQFVTEGRSRYILQSSFFWSRTDEGTGFWDNADDEFLQWLESDEQTEQKAIDKEAALKGFTTDELRAELKRRNAEGRAERESVLRCRMCRHWGSIDYWGNPLNSDFRDKRSCRFFKTKNGKNYRCHNASQLACEHFERKEE